MSRYTFAELTKKLTLLTENHHGSFMHQTSTASSINSSNSSLNCTPPISIKNGYIKRNSIDLTITSHQAPISKIYNQSISEPLQRDPQNKDENELQLSLAHRRSLSEHVIISPQHTVPADKARCHQLQRTNSKLQDVIEMIPTYSNLTLRKVAETMFLKDPQYKPRPKEDSKPNPFAALAQLRGVKKILGANATTYTPGAGDLFSSCFEISSPFLKNLREFNGRKKDQLTCEHQNQPKSLPNSPLVSRKEFTMDPMTGSLHEVIADAGKCGKKCFDGLQNHPLYKSGKHETESNADTSLLRIAPLPILPKITTTTIASTASHSYTKLIDKAEPSFVETPSTGTTSSFYETPRLLTRRGSTESGFFSCLNEDFCDKTNIDAMNTVSCTCYPTPSANGTPASAKKEDASTDSSSVSLRSLDDLELSETHQNRHICPHHRHIDIDARSIDMGLINRLALDTEINTLIQKHQLSNTLFHCKNRTSSIYSDSSDSLAGSDSLLWDDRSYPIPNTRSAQIAKIVEYFERKGANFKGSNSATVAPTFAVPEMKTSSSFVSPTRNYFPPSTSSYHHHKQLTDYFVDLRRDFNDLTHSTGSGGSTSFGGLASSYKRDYETFCLELAEKKNPQNFHKICEGLVKSKLQLFDKLKQNNQPEK